MRGLARRLVDVPVVKGCHVRVEIVEHDPAWADRFTEVGAQLREVFADLADRIDHIGSTSVAGLAAKPVIDVQVSVSTLDDLETFRGPLADLSLDLVVNEDRRKWYATRRTPGAETNVHIRTTGEFSQQAALLLRDYLRAEQSARSRYERVKRELAERPWARVDDYADAKSDIVWQLLREADRWGWHGWQPGDTDA